ICFTIGRVGNLFSAWNTIVFITLNISNFPLLLISILLLLGAIIFILKLPVCGSNISLPRCFDKSQILASNSIFFFLNELGNSGNKTRDVKRAGIKIPALLIKFQYPKEYRCESFIIEDQFNVIYL